MIENLAIHTITTKPWTLQQCIEGYTRHGVHGISVWRNVLEPVGLKEASRMLDDHQMRVPALVRGGFFTATDAATRDSAIDDNRVCIDEAAAIGAEQVVLVCGAVPGMPLEVARQQTADALEKLLPYAQQHKIKLSIEPLHPMYAYDRSAVNTMAQARRICEQLQSPWLGIACDVYHVWWDETLEDEIKLAGQQGTLLGFHLCDWRSPRDLLNDRALMGDGCINLRQIRGWVQAAGFDGMDEVEIFSNEHWAEDQDAYVKRIVERYQECCL